MTDLSLRYPTPLSWVNSSSSFRSQFISPLWFVQILPPSPAQQVQTFPRGSPAVSSVLPKPLIQTSIPASVVLYSSSLAFLIDGDLFSFFTLKAFSSASYEFLTLTYWSFSRWPFRLCYVLGTVRETPCCKTQVLSPVGGREIKWAVKRWLIRSPTPIIKPEILISAVRLMVLSWWNPWGWAREIVLPSEVKT